MVGVMVGLVRRCRGFGAAPRDLIVVLLSEV